MVKKNLQMVRGMRDLLFEEAEKLVQIIDIARKVSYAYGYREAILPTIEYFSLFSEKSGYEIKKRMYVFEDLSKRKLALRPELTPSVARVFINKLVAHPKPIRICYFSNVFRYDEPQKARYREFWQAGFEHIGSSSLVADCEIIMLCYDIFKELNISDGIKVKIGSMDLIKKILKYANVKEEKIPECLFLIDKRKFDELKKILISNEKGKRAFEILLSLSNLKGNLEKIFEEAQKILKINNDFLLSLKNTKQLIEYLNNLNINRINLDLSFARGIEYYTGIIYEFYHERLNVAIGGGGRYDLLIEYYGGPKTPSTGCALGLDRIFLIYKFIQEKKKFKCLIYMINENKEVVRIIFKIISQLRNLNIISTIESSGRNIKEALSYAIKNNFNFFIVIGEKEIKSNKITVKFLKEKKQLEIKLNELKSYFEDYVRS